MKRASRTEVGRFIAKTVGAELRFLRQEAELTQNQIAEATGIHRPIVARIERGKHCPSLEVVEAYARALELEVLDVLACLDEHWAEVCRLIEAEKEAA